MSLFLVNRYLGEEEDAGISKDSQSQLLLAKLQQKAKQKQKQRLTEETEFKHEEQTEQQVKKKREAESDGSQEHQHHKRRKSEAVDHCTSVSDNHDEPIKEKKKKKKGANEKQKTKDQSDKSAEGGSPGSLTDGAESKGEQAPAETEKDSSEQRLEKPSVPAGFTVLGGFESKPAQKVHRVLPQWLAEPDVIRRDIKSNLVPVSDVSGVCPELLKKLQKNGVQHFFPVQAEVIPAILDSAQHGVLVGRGGYRPRDICVSAPTGSGKTLSFVIPVVQVLMERVVCEVRALVMLPTKELAQQVYKVFGSYAEGTPLKVVMLAGQKSFAAEQTSLTEQRGSLRRSAADIVVATPGRLVDHINKKSGLCLEHLRFLIIDEADRMIDSMHHSWLSQVMKAVYGSRGGPEAMNIFRRTEPACITAASLSPPQVPLQKLLFSATLTQNPEKLQQLGLHRPKLFSSVHSPSDNNTPAAPAQNQDRFDFPQGLTEYYVPCTMSKKPLLILHFILRMKLSPILCFTNSKETAHRLYLLLHLFGGIQAAEFSSRLSPGERKRTLKNFEQGKIHVLISTDAAARGIDITGVKCVVNYDAPQYVRTYVHRVGRTARAGKAGLAFTFLLRVQEKNFLQMVVEAGSPGIQKQMVKPESLKSMEERYEQVLQKLADVIKGEKTR